MFKVHSISHLTTQLVARYSISCISVLTKHLLIGWWVNFYRTPFDQIKKDSRISLNIAIIISHRE